MSWLLNDFLLHRVPTHFQKLFSKLFQYPFNTKLKNINTITFLHLSQIIFMERNAKNIYKSVVSGKEKTWINKCHLCYVDVYCVSVFVLFRYLYVYFLSRFFSKVNKCLHYNFHTFWILYVHFGQIQYFFKVLKSDFTIQYHVGTLTL